MIDLIWIIPLSIAMLILMIILGVTLIGPIGNIRKTEHLKHSNNSLKRAISKTKNENLKKELQKRLDDNERYMGYEYYP